MVRVIPTILGILLLALLSAVGRPSKAAQVDEEGTIYYQTGTPLSRADTLASLFRISLLGHFGVAAMQESGAEIGGNLNEQTEPSNMGQGGALLVDMGRGRLGLQTGVQLVTLPLTASAQDLTAEQKEYSFNLDAKYVGVPALVKYNYIEATHAVFSVKAGVMLAWLQGESEIDLSNSNAIPMQNLSLLGSDEMLVIGASGSAPFNKYLSLLVDATYLRGMNDLDGYGARNEGLLLGVGLTFFL